MQCIVLLLFFNSEDNPKDNSKDNPKDNLNLLDMKFIKATYLIKHNIRVFSEEHIDGKFRSRYKSVKRDIKALD